MKISVATKDGLHRKLVELEDQGRASNGDYVTRFRLDGIDHFSRFARGPRDDDRVMWQKRETLDLAFLAHLGFDPTNLEVLS